MKRDEGMRDEVTGTVTLSLSKGCFDKLSMT